MYKAYQNVTKTRDRQMTSIVGRARLGLRKIQGELFS